MLHVPKVQYTPPPPPREDCARIHANRFGRRGGEVARRQRGSALSALFTHKACPYLAVVGSSRVQRGRAGRTPKKGSAALRTCSTGRQPAGLQAAIKCPGEAWRRRGRRGRLAVILQIARPAAAKRAIIFCCLLFSGPCGPSGPVHASAPPPSVPRTARPARRARWR